MGNGMNEELEEMSAEELREEAIGYMADVLDLHDFNAERTGSKIIVDAADGRRIVFTCRITNGETK